MSAADWDALVRPGAGPLHHAFLEAATRIELPAFEYRPQVVPAPGPGGRYAAHAPGCRYDLDGGLFATGGAARALALVRSVRRRFFVFPVFELGCPVALCEPFSVAPGVDPVAAVDALLRAAIDTAEIAGAEVVVAHAFEPQATPGGAIAALARAGFAPVPLPPNFILDLDGRFETFDTYLDAMRAPYRRRAHRRLERAASLRPELGPPSADAAPELARLWRATYDRARENRREILTEEFFRAVAGVPRVRVLELRRTDRSLAVFALLHEDGATLRFLYSGFHVEAREEGAYFRLLYEIVRIAIEGRFARVDLGWTTAEAKLDLGARIVPLEAWVRHRSRARQRLLAWSLRTLFRPSAPAARRVFRAEGIAPAHPGASGAPGA